MAQPTAFSSLLINNNSFGITGGIPYVNDVPLVTVSNNFVYTTGTQTISGNKLFANNISVGGIISGGVIDSYGSSGRLNKSGLLVLNWFNRLLYDSNSNTSIDFQNKLLEAGGTASLSWSSYVLLNNGQTIMSWADQNGPIFKLPDNTLIPSLSNGQLTWSLDEATDQLLLSVKYSDGTPKSGIINLI